MASETAWLDQTLNNCRIIACLGSGGVGKTTLSAALSVRAAMQGKRVLCLTIDPAKRLAQSLGLERMQEELHQVPTSLWQQHALHPKGQLAVMMLDMKRTFDDLIRAHTDDSELRQRIFDNRFYQYISTSLAGTREYMAMEKLHMLHADAQWDLIILDTPPSTHALDFLRAPQRMINLLDSQALRWLGRSMQRSGAWPFGWLQRGSSLFFQAISRFTGSAFVEELTGLIQSLNTLFGGFRERAQTVANTLRGDSVAFVIVARPDPVPLDEARVLAEALRQQDMGEQRCCLAINDLQASIAPADDTLFASCDQGQSLAAVVQQYREMVTQQQQALIDVQSLGDRVTTTFSLPAMSTPIHDLGALANLGQSFQPLELA